MYGFAKLLLIVCLSILAGAISLTLIAASLIVVNHLRDNQPLALPMNW